MMQVLYSCIANHAASQTGPWLLTFTTYLISTGCEPVAAEGEINGYNLYIEANETGIIGMTIFMSRNYEKILRSDPVTHTGELTLSSPNDCWLSVV